MEGIKSWFRKDIDNFQRYFVDYEGGHGLAPSEWGVYKTSADHLMKNKEFMDELERVVQAAEPGTVSENWLIRMIANLSKREYNNTRNLSLGKSGRIREVTDPWEGLPSAKELTEMGPDMIRRLDDFLMSGKLKPGDPKWFREMYPSNIPKNSRFYKLRQIIDKEHDHLGKKADILQDMDKDWMSP